MHELNSSHGRGRSPSPVMQLGTHHEAQTGGASHAEGGHSGGGTPPRTYARHHHSSGSAGTSHVRSSSIVMTELLAEVTNGR